jgi:hypothetical protein
MRRTNVKRTIAALFAASALVVAGCGGDDADGEPMDEAPSEMTDESGDMAEDGAEDGAEDMAEDESMDDAESEMGEEGEAGAAPGVYREYSEESVAEAGFDTTVIFFHASWCSECRAFEQAIESEELPAGLQILKADYDTATDLVDRYDVRIQTTFVKVDSNGDEISSWVGYQKDRSVDTILRELG